MEKFIPSDLGDDKKSFFPISEKSNESNKYNFEDIEKIRNFNKDAYTRGHSDRVSAYSVLIGKYLGLPENQLDLLRIGGLFHDIGKTGIPDNILFNFRK